MFRNVIKDRRTALGLSLQEVADKCGVNKSTVLRWENGRCESLKQDKVLLLSRILQVSPSVLLGISDEECQEWDYDPKTNSIAVELSDLTEEELASVMNYIAFIKSQRGKT